MKKIIAYMIFISTSFSSLTYAATATPRCEALALEAVNAFLKLGYPNIVSNESWLLSSNYNEDEDSDGVFEQWQWSLLYTNNKGEPVAKIGQSVRVFISIINSETNGPKNRCVVHSITMHYPD